MDLYIPVNEDGTMLIICYGPFIESMQPFIEWKTKRGMQTELVDVADIGDADAIKTYVEEYYYTYGLNFLLLQLLLPVYIHNRLLHSHLPNHHL